MWVGDDLQLRVYLDNCCFNRPYDDQSYVSVSLEAQAKLYIQDLIRNGQLEMATSYMLVYENGQNPYEMRKTAITKFIEDNTTVYVSAAKLNDVSVLAHEIMKTGVKYKDACHIVCAIMSGSDYFLTTDRRLLKYHTNKLKIMNPTEFIREWEV